MANTQSNTTLTPSGHGNAPNAPRYLNAALGAWLFISAFVWPHAAPELANAWVVGILMFSAALIAIGSPPVRFVNTALAVWLFLSTLAIGGVRGTVWNHVVVALFAFILSLMPNETTPRAPARRST